MKINGLNSAAVQIFDANVKKGFYVKPREIGTLLMLCVSEISEALEADRKSKIANVHSLSVFIRNGLDCNVDSVFKAEFESHIKDTFEDEIADTIIRLLDLCGYKNIDIEKHIELKLRYNETREHMHGKLY